MIDKHARPEPDALLTEARKEGLGRLKIFLGAAPGVGKTYAMLEAAAHRQKEGVDVVAAIVESHGRKETEALFAGLEILPRITLTYRGQVFLEMDLDAVLRRRPQLVLVDELAHTNIEGSRHSKRWQDVEEILKNGIDVYSTLNIQHLESLNEIVQRVTWVKIRETLPDSVLAMADEIELIDLPPEELIQRLREGKVYMPDQAQMAIKHYFSKGNLTALRELAMRTAAERVDSDMIGYMKSHAVSSLWPVRERLIVCVDESGNAVDLIRTTSRQAKKDRIPWIALHVERNTDHLLSEGEKDNIDNALRLAEELGGEAVTIRGGTRIADDILSFAQSRNATRLIIGRSGKPWYSELMMPSISGQIVSRAKDFDVILLHATAKDKNEGSLQRYLVNISGKPLIREFIPTTLSVLVALGAALLSHKILPLANLSLVFLMPVLFSGVRYGLWPSLYAAVIGVAAYNFFFTEPYHTFNVHRTSDIATLIFFIMVAFVTGNMAVRLKNQMEALRTAARRNAQMHEFSRKLASALTLTDIMQETVTSISLDMDIRTAVILPEPKEGKKLYIASHYPPQDCRFTSTDWGAAEWAWKNVKVAGRGSDTLPAASWYFVPLRGPQGVVALLAVAPLEHKKDEEFLLSPPARRMLFSYCDQAVLAIERAQLSDDIEENRIVTETEKLRSALLSSISHDLRTPLVSIMGSATSLHDLDDSLTPDNKRELLDNILEETTRLNRFIQNLLDMTKLGHGKLKPKWIWVEFRDVLGRALKRLERDLESRKIDIRADEGLETLYLDPVLMEQVFLNILDNATKYTPAQAAIDITFTKDKDKVLLTFTDHGPGIPEKDREQVFDMFYRVKSTDSKIAGTGLGLAICRGLVEAHGGTIHAESGPNGKGTSIVITFPAVLSGGTLAKMNKDAHG